MARTITTLAVLDVAEARHIGRLGVGEGLYARWQPENRGLAHEHLRS